MHEVENDILSMDPNQSARFQVGLAAYQKHGPAVTPLVNEMLKKEPENFDQEKFLEKVDLLMQNRPVQPHDL